MTDENRRTVSSANATIMFTEIMGTRLNNSTHVRERLGGITDALPLEVPDCGEMVICF